MGPRADFFCERCQEKGLCSPEHPYRDLPVKKPKCPDCGASRWMKRLYAGYSPMISTNGDMQKFKIADQNVESQMLMHENQRRSAHAGEIHARRAESVVPGMDMRVRAVNPSQLAGTVAAVGGLGRVRAPIGPAEISPNGGPLVSAAIDGAAKTAGRTRFLADPAPAETAKAVGL